MMKTTRILLAVVLLTVCGMVGCVEKEPVYGREPAIWLPGFRAQVWAVAPAVNLSGQKQVDPLLQADLLFEQLQQVKGLTVVPVNRVAEAYASLRIDGIHSQEQAELVCDLLGCDGLLVPTVTLYDSYDPPKLGAALQWFARGKGGSQTKRVPQIDPRELARMATPGEYEALPNNLANCNCSLPRHGVRGPLFD